VEQSKSPNGVLNLKKQHGKLQDRSSKKHDMVLWLSELL